MSDKNQQKLADFMQRRTFQTSYMSSDDRDVGRLLQKRHSSLASYLFQKAKAENERNKRSLNLASYLLAKANEENNRKSKRNGLASYLLRKANTENNRQAIKNLYMYG